MKAPAIPVTVLMMTGLLAASVSPAQQPRRAADTRHVTRIILLGTNGGPIPDAARSEPASVLMVDGKPILIDAGAGVSQRLSDVGLSPLQIQTVFITHHHVDHNAGLESLISLSWFARAWRNIVAPPMQIYGPPATAFLVQKSLEFLSVSERIFSAGVPQLQPAAPLFKGHDIDHDGVVLDTPALRVTAAENTHFRFKSFSPAGVQDRSYSYRFDTPAGSVVFTGDTGPTPAIARLARGAQVLVSEVCADATCGAGSTDQAAAARLTQTPPPQQPAAEKYHMVHEHITPEEVGRMAAQAHVKLVILTHLVGGRPGSGSAAEFTAGVRKYFSGPVIVGRDLFEYDLVAPAAGQGQQP